jgi:hypothetical protein
MWWLDKFHVLIGSLFLLTEYTYPLFSPFARFSLLFFRYWVISGSQPKLTQKTMHDNLTDLKNNQPAVLARHLRFVRRLKSKANLEWRNIWNQYPHDKRTPEDRQIVHDEQIRINGYVQALDDILANAK